MGKVMNYRSAAASLSLAAGLETALPVKKDDMDMIRLMSVVHCITKLGLKLFARGGNNILILICANDCN